MISLGDSYIAVDTWILGNLDKEPLKEILSKYINLIELKKS